MKPVQNDLVERPERMATMTELRISVVGAIDEISAADWDACANATSEVNTSRSDLAYNPLVSHDFLSALEESKSVGGRTGWEPQHVLARTVDGDLVAAAPCYLKSHSRGEYVFDRGWAEAYERAGGSYYPKLQIAVPFTPATGRRLLLRQGPDSDAIGRAVGSGLMELCKLSGASGVHVTFAT